MRRTHDEELSDHRLYSVASVCHLEDMSAASVHRLVRAGEFEAVRDGTRIKITGKSIRQRRERLPRVGASV